MSFSWDENIFSLDILFRRKQLFSVLKNAEISTFFPLLNCVTRNIVSKEMSVINFHKTIKFTLFTNTQGAQHLLHLLYSKLSPWTLQFNDFLRDLRLSINQFLDLLLRPIFPNWIKRIFPHEHAPCSSAFPFCIFKLQLCFMKHVCKMCLGGLTIVTARWVSIFMRTYSFSSFNCASQRNVSASLRNLLKKLLILCLSFDHMNCSHQRREHYFYHYWASIRIKKYLIIC